MDLQIYPLLFEPVYKEVIWGGNRISSYTGKKVPIGENPVGESWQICDRGDKQCVVTNGSLTGKTLRELVEASPGKIVGSRHESDQPFPIMVKLLDSSERLSLQVHPDEVIAKKYPGSEPKNEMWYMLDHDEGAQICAGLRFDKTQLQFRTRIGTDKLEECVQTFSSNKGDAYYIAAGTVHSIGGGNLILEVQQNSDTTYRVHDWGRVDKDGEPRELHVEEALDCIHFKDRGLPLIRVDERPVRANKKKSLVRPNKFFMSEELKIVSDFFSKTSDKTFHLLSSTGLPFTVKFGNEELLVPKGDTCLLPAALGEYQIQPQTGSTLTVIRSMLSM